MNTSKEEIERWREASDSLQQLTEDDRLSQAEGESLYSRALEMSDDEWSQFRRRFAEMPVRGRLHCFGSAFRKREGDNDHTRQKVIHRHLGTLVLEAFGIKPGEEGVGMVPRAPEVL